MSKVKKPAKVVITPKQKTPQQIARKKAKKSYIARAERRATLPGNKQRAEEQATALEAADTAKMQEKMEAPIPETSVPPTTPDAIDDILAPGQDVTTTSL
jgi:hypothetical protein